MSSRRTQTRIKLLESARRLLVKRGYHGVGMEEVARDAGVSRQALYLHFKSKADLLVAMVQYHDDSIGVPEILRPVHEAESAVEAIDKGVAAYGIIEPQIYDAASVIYSARQSDEAAEAAWRDRMAFRRANIRQGMERLRKEGLLAEGWSVECGRSGGLRVGPSVSTHVRISRGGTGMAHRPVRGSPPNGPAGHPSV